MKPTSKNPDAARWDTLLERAKRLQPPDTPYNPSIIRGIPEMLAISLERTNGGRASANDEAQARKLFADIGHPLDLDKHTRDINNLDLSSMYKPVEEHVAVNVDDYLEDMHNKMLDKIVNESLGIHSQTLNRRFRENALQDWQKEKQDIRGDSTWTLIEDSLRGADITNSFGPHLRMPNSDTSLSFNAYVRGIVALNEKRKDGESCKLIQLLQNVNLLVKDDTEGESRYDCWSLLGHMIDEEGAVHGHERIYMQEGHFRNEYLSHDPKLKSKLIRAARRYLERTFRAEMCAMTGNDNNEKPMKIVDNYISMNKAIVDRSRVWASVFLLYRAGFGQEALQMLKRIDHPELHHFVNCLDHSINAREPLPQRMRHSLESEYRDVKKGRCTFQIAMYNLVGRFEPNPNVDLPLIQSKNEDYLWLKLCFLWNYDHEMSQSMQSVHSKSEGVFAVMTLGNWQSILIREERTFQNKPLMYFSMLLTSLQFEKAITFLRHHRFQLAIHFAIALNYYGLIRCERRDIVRPVPNFSTSSIFADEMKQEASPEPPPSVKMHRMIQTYIRRDEIHRYPDTAFQYILVLYNYEPRSTENDTFREMLNTLLLTTRSFERLVQDDGCIRTFLPKEEQDKVLKRAADGFLAADQAKSCIRLLILVQNYQLALDIICEEMLKSVRQGRNDVAKVEGMRFFAENARIIKDLNKENRSIQEKLNGEFAILQTISSFYDHKHARHHKLALEIFKQMALFPETNDPTKQSSAVIKLRHLNENLKELLLNVVENVILILDEWVTTARNMKSNARGETQKEIAEDIEEMIQKKDRLILYVGQAGLNSSRRSKVLDFSFNK